MHIEVDPAMTVAESHEIARQVRVHLREKLDWVADVLVHVEPAESATATRVSPRSRPYRAGLPIVTRPMRFELL